MASITSLKASDGSGNASVATVQSVRSPLATTLVVDTVQGINTKFHATMGTPHTFVDPVTSETITVISEATAVDFKGHVDGGNLEIDTIAPGFTDNGSAVSDIVIIKPTTQWADEMADVLDVVHEDNGELKPEAPINSPQGTLANVTPVGSVLDFAGTSAPTGWLLCYGQALDATATPAYQDLFDVIGNTFGGTNNTNFVVPDLRGRVVAGQDDMGGSSANRLTNPGTTTGGIDGDGLGNTGGSETHALTSAQNGTHTHNGLLMDENPSFEIGITGLGGSDSFQRNVAGGSSTSGYNIGTKSSGSGSGHNNVQPTIILNKIIKY